jgi:hypothetical protein
MNDAECYQFLPAPTISTSQLRSAIKTEQDVNDDAADDDDDDDDNLYERIHDTKPSDLSSPTAPIEEETPNDIYDYDYPSMAIESCKGADSAQLEDDSYKEPVPGPQLYVNILPMPKEQPQKPADSKFSRSTIPPSIPPPHEDSYDDILSPPSPSTTPIPKKALPKVSKVQIKYPTDHRFPPPSIPPPLPPAGLHESDDDIPLPPLPPTSIPKKALPKVSKKPTGYRFPPPSIPPPPPAEDEYYDDIPSLPSLPSTTIALSKVSKVQPTGDKFSPMPPPVVPPPTPPPVALPPTPPRVVPPPTPPDVKDIQPPEASCTDGYEEMDFGESDDDGIYEHPPPVARQEDSSDGSDKEPTIDPDEYTYIDGASGKSRAGAAKKRSLQRALSADYIRNRVAEPANDQVQMLIEQMQEMKEMLVQMEAVYISSQAPPGKNATKQPTPLVPETNVTIPTHRSSGATVSCKDDEDSTALETCEDQKAQAAHQMKKVFSKFVGLYITHLQLYSLILMKSDDETKNALFPWFFRVET